MANYQTDYAKGLKIAINASQSEAIPQRFEFVQTGIALALNDVLEMGPLLADHSVVDVILDADDMDTGGPTLTLSVGILNAAKSALDLPASGGAAWILASTVAGAPGGVARMVLTHALRMQPQAYQRNIGIVVAAAATTPVVSLTNLNVNRGFWQPVTTYTANDFITLPNGVRQKCTTGGVSGLVRPQFHTLYNNTTADGTAVWTTADPVIGLTVITRSPHFGS